MTTSRGIPLPDVPGVRGITETGQVQFQPPPEAPPAVAPAPAEKETPLSKRVKRQFEESKIFTRKEIKQAGLDETPKTWEVEGYQRWYYDSPEGRQIILQDIARSRASRGLPIDWESLSEAYVPDTDFKRRRKVKPIHGSMGITAGEYERITGAAPVAGRPPKRKIQPAKPEPVKPAWQQEIEDWGRKWVDQAKTLREQREKAEEVKTYSDKVVVLTTLDVTPKWQRQPTEKIKSTIWGYLTPWRETEGETVSSWFKDKFISPKVESQQALQSEYIKSADQPLWSRLLFGQDVVYDENSGRYGRLVKGYGPPVGGKLPVKTLARVDWKTLERVAKPPDANWNWVRELIARGTLKTPKQLTTMWQRGGLAEQPGVPLPGPAGYTQLLADIATTQPAPMVTGLTKTKLYSVVLPMINRSPNQSVKDLVANGLLLPAIAIHPARTIENINTASPDVRESAMVQLSPHLREIIKSGDEIQARVLAVQEAQVQSHVAAINEQIVDTEVRLANEGATDVQIQQAVSNLVQEATETIADPVTRTEVETQVQTATQTVTQPQTRTQTRTRVVTPTQVGPAPRVPVLQPSILQPRIVTPEKEKIPPKPPRWPYKVDRPSVSRRIPDGSLAWRNGFNWRYIPPPYNQLKPISLGNVAPVGAKVGGRSVIDTLQIIGRSRARVPRVVAIDLGFVDITIKNGRQIVFTGGGQDTDIGLRDPSPTMGMSVINGGIDRPSFRGVEPLERGDRVEIRELRGEEERMLRPGMEQEYEPEEIEAYEPREPAPKPEPSDVDDLFSVTHEDIQGKHDGNSTDDGDYSEITMLTDEDEGDVIEVTDADIYGEAPTTKRSVRRFQRTSRSYQPPPSSLGGMRV